MTLTKAYKTFSAMDLKRFGNDLMLAGAVYSNGRDSFIMHFPGEPIDLESEVIATNIEEWHELIKQTDSMTTEVEARAKDGTIEKAIVRKCERNIETAIQWRVFKRDGYTCRYCGEADRPLTVDHLITWESSGPTIEANLLAACKSCNKLRGNLSYEQWLASSDYKGKSKKLPPDVRKANEDVLATLSSIALVPYVKKR